MFVPRTWKSKKLVHAKPSQYSSRIRFLTNLRTRCQLFNSKTAFTYRESCLGMISHGSLSNKNLNHRTNAFTRKIGPNHASRKKIGDLQVTFFFCIRSNLSKYIHVIYRLGGPYWEKLCPRSWVPRPRAQFLPIRTNLSRWVTFLFFCYWDLKVSGKFYCSLQPMCVKEGRVRVDAIQSARSIANQNKTLQHDF